MEKRITVMTEPSRKKKMSQPKGSFQSRSYLFHDWINPMTATLYGKFDFEQFLIDSEGQYWFTEKTLSGKETSQIFVFNTRGAFIKNLAVKGKPILYDFEYFLIAACEGRDGRSYIYKICKKHLQIINEWTIDGFFWDLENINEALYITSYLPEINEAVLYIINGNRKRAIDLGESIFPTGILFQNGSLYIAYSFVYNRNKGKMARYDLDGVVLEEYFFNVGSRQMLTYKDKIVLHGLDMTKGSADRLVYFNVENGHCLSYKIPNTSDIRPEGKQVLLHHHETDSIIYWSHEKRKIIRVVHIKMPIKAQIENTHWSL